MWMLLRLVPTWCQAGTLSALLARPTTHPDTPSSAQNDATARDQAPVQGLMARWGHKAQHLFTVERDVVR